MIDDHYVAWCLKRMRITWHIFWSTPVHTPCTCWHHSCRAWKGLGSPNQGKYQNQPGNLWNKWVVWVWITEKWANWEQHLRTVCKISTKKNHGRQCKASEYMPDIWIKTYLTLDTVSAGDHWDLSMSRQIAPLLKVIITKCEKVVFFGFTCWCLGGRFWLWMWILGAENITK